MDERRIKIIRQRSTYRFASDTGTPQFTPLACTRRAPQAMAGRICAAPSPASAWSATFIESPLTRLSSPLEAHTQPPTLHYRDLEYTYWGPTRSHVPLPPTICRAIPPTRARRTNSMPNEVSSTVPLAYPPACALHAHALNYSRFSRGGATPRRWRQVFFQYWPRSACRPSSQAPRGLRVTRPSQERSGSASTPTGRAQPPTGRMRQRHTTHLSIFRARSRGLAFNPAPPRNSVGTVVPAVHELRVRPHPSYAFLFSHSPRPRNIFAPRQRPRSYPVASESTMWYRNICVASHIPFSKFGFSRGYCASRMRRAQNATRIATGTGNVVGTQTWRRVPIRPLRAPASRPHLRELISGRHTCQSELGPVQENCSASFAKLVA